MKIEMPRLSRLLEIIRMGSLCIPYGNGVKDKLNIALWDALEFLQILTEKRFSSLKAASTAVTKDLSKDITVSVDGLKFHPVDLQSLYILTPLYDEAMWRFLRPKVGEVFVDIGAHIGKYAISVARIVGEKGLVVAVEPHPTNYETLLRNIEMNRLENIATLKVAAWNKLVKLRLYTTEKSGDHSVKRRRDRRYIEVEGCPIDSTIEEMGVERVDWVKIDAEGAEFEAIEGLRKTIAEYSPKLIVEIMNENTFKLLRELGYTFFRIPSRTVENYFCEKETVYQRNP